MATGLDDTPVSYGTERVNSVSVIDVTEGLIKCQPFERCFPRESVIDQTADVIKRGEAEKRVTTLASHGLVSQCAVCHDVKTCPCAGDGRLVNERKVARKDGDLIGRHHVVTNRQVRERIAKMADSDIVQSEEIIDDHQAALTLTPRVISSRNEVTESALCRPRSQHQQCCGVADCNDQRVLNRDLPLDFSLTTKSIADSWSEQCKTVFKLAKGCHCTRCRRKVQRVRSMPNSSKDQQAVRGNGCSKVYAGDEHWTKKLQAKEPFSYTAGGVGGSRGSFSDSSSTAAGEVGGGGRGEDEGGGGGRGGVGGGGGRNVFHILYSRFVDWVTAARHESRDTSSSHYSLLSRFSSIRRSSGGRRPSMATPEETRQNKKKSSRTETSSFRCSAAGGSPMHELDLQTMRSSTEKVRSECQKSAISPSSEESDVGILSSPYKAAVSEVGIGAAGGWGLCSYSSGSSPKIASTSTLSSGDGSSSSNFNSKFTSDDQTSIFTDGTNYSVPWRRRLNLACEDLKRKPANSGAGVGSSHGERLKTASDRRIEKDEIPKSAIRRLRHADAVEVEKRTVRNVLTTLHDGCRIPQYRSLNLPDKDENDLFFHTWPPLSAKYEEPGTTETTDSSCNDGLADNEPVGDVSVQSDAFDDVIQHQLGLHTHGLDNRDNTGSFSVRTESEEEEARLNSTVEWEIPYGDLIIERTLRVGRNHTIHKGRWHGEVIIHTFNGATNLSKFLNEVVKLSRIRHENVCLFMGACIRPPHLAVVTCELKGTSLYSKLHLQSDRMSMRICLSIARQVSLAMGYLHAKGVVVRNLNSKNIHLEPKVKLSLLDNSMAQEKHTRINYGCMPRGNLCYVAPEMLRTIRVVGPQLLCLHESTRETDVFAFGTLMYELVNEMFPFFGEAVETVIWKVGRGQQSPISTLNCNPAIKALIERCWSLEPTDRPQFIEINHELQHKTGLHKRHSSSQPERLNRSSFTSHLGPGKRK